MNTHTLEKGFTLIETLVALTILAIALVGTWKLNIAVLHNDVTSHKKATATHLANQKLEELKSDSFTTLALGQQQDCCTREGDQCASACDGKTFRREWTIANPPISIPDTRQVVVQVGWGGKTCSTNLNNCDHVIELLTFITNI